MHIMKQAVAIVPLIFWQWKFFQKTLYGIMCLPLRLCNDFTAACLDMSGRYTPGAQVFIMHFILHVIRSYAIVIVAYEKVC